MGAVLLTPSPADATQSVASPRIIWGGAYGGGIWQSTNGQRSLLTSRTENPNEIIVEGQHIWWADNSTSDNIYEATIGNDYGIAAGSGYLYWGDYSGPIMRAPERGGRAGVVIARSGVDGIVSVAVEQRAAHSGQGS